MKKRIFDSWFLFALAMGFVAGPIVAMIVANNFTGCAVMTPTGQTTTVVPYADMSVKQKSIFLMDFYNKQFDLYQMQAGKSSHTDTEKIVLNKKYDTLKKIYPYIAMYNGYADTGSAPPAEVEAALITLINSLKPGSI